MKILANTVVFVESIFLTITVNLGKIYSHIWGQIQWYLGEIQGCLGANIVVF